MKLHQWHALGWAGIIVLFVVWEAIGLWSRADAYHPFTHYVRRAVAIEPVWFLVAGFLAWLPYHFLVKH